MIETVLTKKSALLVIPIEEVNDSALREEELCSLVKTMGVDVISSIVFRVREYNSATMLGKGQVEEVKENILYYEPDLVVFDTSLEPRILRNLEASLDICVIDREEVILQIFADRAQTKEAKLQVALARAEYSLPRLRRRWEELSQQRGGVKGSRGAGERQLELDKRKLSERIITLKRELEEVKKIRNVQRKSRDKNKAYSFSLVGYTNAGKSSLLNLLTNANTFVEDKLFATLDPTTRAMKLKGRVDITVTDTVGFVSNLPHHLISAFSSTLEEAKYADTLIIVVDLANPDCEKCHQTTLEVLSSLGAGDNDKKIVFNKIDSIANEIAYERLKVAIPNHIEISVKNKVNIDTLIDEMYERVINSKKRFTVYLEPEDGKALSEIYSKYTVLSNKYEDGKMVVEYLS
ncbi:GTPase HflX [Bullifex sp.]|uniref:GTPase HflX n=1 Tax=Bullifex sp. TaxID=2815808 RepID=UPI002A81CCC6|nr:GTPase HflX [Bullifex sp.]MDY4067889.1 GTPase HflX [Bullifex sp.]